jgi:hypothetical protein
MGWAFPWRGYMTQLLLSVCRSQWPCGLRRRSSAARLLRLWVPIPPEAWMFVCCECCVLSGRGLCDGLITCPEESYRMWRIVVCDLETSKPRRLKPATGLWKIQPQWVVTPGKQTDKQTNYCLCKSICHLHKRLPAADVLAADVFGTDIIHLNLAPQDMVLTSHAASLFCSVFPPLPHPAGVKIRNWAAFTALSTEHYRQ